MRDKLESFVLAETLKYAYLLLSPPPPQLPAGQEAQQAQQTHGSSSRNSSMWEELTSLRGWVLNTEAHPLRILSSLPSEWRELSESLSKALQAQQAQQGSSRAQAEAASEPGSEEREEA
jgi:hypothetical protein